MQRKHKGRFSFIFCDKGWFAVPVRKILMGYDIGKAVSRDAMQNPASIDYFIAFAKAQTDYRIDP